MIIFGISFEGIWVKQLYLMKLIHNTWTESDQTCFTKYASLLCITPIDRLQIVVCNWLQILMKISSNVIY